MSAGDSAKASTKQSKNKSASTEYTWTPAKLKKRDNKRAEYASDFLKWAQDCAKIIDREHPDGARLIPFKPSASQLSLLQLRDDVMAFRQEYSTKMNAQDGSYPISKLPCEIICLKARKVYVSTLIELLGFWKAEFNDHTNVMVMAHEAKASRNIAAMARRVHQNWSNNTDPPLRNRITRLSDELIEWDPGWESKMIVMTAGSGGASSAGFTYHFLHLSEVPKFPDENVEVSNAEQAAATFREIYWEATADGQGNLFHEGWQNAMWIEDAWKLLREDKPFPATWNGKFRWFWGWWQDKDYRIPVLPHERKEMERTLTDREKWLMNTYGCTLDQLKWRRQKIRGECSRQRKMAPELYFMQEYPSNPEEAFLATGSTVFDKTELDQMLQQANADFETACKYGHLVRDSQPSIDGQWVDTWRFELAPFADGSTFFQWEEPVPGSWYSIGIDVAEGLPQGDWSVISIYDRTDGTFLREAARAMLKVDPDELAEIAIYLARLYNDAYITCERNKDGSATNIRFVKLGYPHIYHGRNEEIFKSRDNSEAFTAGFITTPRTKPLLVSRGITAVRHKHIQIRHPEAIRQWKVFKRRDGADRYGAPDGDNDDCCIADLLAIWGDEEGPKVHGARLGGVVAEVSEDLTPEQQRKKWLTEQIAKVIEKQREYNRQQQEIRESLAAVEDPYTEEDLNTVLFD